MAKYFKSFWICHQFLTHCVLRILSINEWESFSTYKSLFQKCSISQPISLREDKNRFLLTYNGALGKLKFFIVRFVIVAFGLFSCLFIAISKLYGYFSSIPFWIFFIQITLGIFATFVLCMNTILYTKGDLFVVAWHAILDQLQEKRFGESISHQ